MRIFVSSVRRGLEVERDSPPGLILALGHEPVRFEDFGAHSMPSREACLRGVETSDVYLLLLGPSYGHVFPETGQSATHDEWVAAVGKGMHRLVFRKVGVEFEPEQEGFARLVGDYANGVFYAEFTDAVDLQAKVAQALRGIESEPSTLTFCRLTSAVEVEWRHDQTSEAWSATQPPWVELHVVPLQAERRSVRLLRELPDQLISALRASGALPLTAGAQPQVGNDAVIVQLPQEGNRRWREPTDGALTAIQVIGSGQVSLYWSLPGDGLGSILDHDVLAATVARGLRLIGALKVLPGSDSALAIGLGGSLSMVSEGRVTAVARSSASLHTGTGPVRVLPDEGVTAAAFDRGADEVARSLVLSLIEQFRSQR